VAQKAPNRRKLYDILQKVYDLPNFGPMVTTDYLREIMQEDSMYLKVKREATYTIPKGTRRNFHSIETLHWLIKVLEQKGKKECGFTSYSPPNLEWMLRMLIWADPTQKDVIFKKSVEERADYRKIVLEQRVVTIDPKYHAFPLFTCLALSWSLTSKSPAGRSRTKITGCISMTSSVKSNAR